MALLIPSGLFLFALLCCAGVAVLASAERGSERKAQLQVATSSRVVVSAEQPVNVQAVRQQVAATPKTPLLTNTTSGSRGTRTSQVTREVHTMKDGKFSTSWLREQCQELSIRVQDMRQQMELIERHIALLEQMSLCTDELEQVRHEYEVLKQKRAAILKISTRLRNEAGDDDTYINTEKRPVMRKFPLETM
jgi:hypothetical protein